MKELIIFTLLPAIIIVWAFYYWKRKSKNKQANPSDKIPPGQAVCAECGGKFDIMNMIRYEDVRVCLQCKPAFMKKLHEGTHTRE